MTLAPALFDAFVIVGKSMWHFALIAIVVKIVKGVVGKTTKLNRRR